MQAVFDVLQWVALVYLMWRNLQLSQESIAHCQQLGQLQAELHEVDPVRFPNPEASDDPR